MRIALLMVWSEVTRMLRIRSVLLMLIGLPLLLIFILGNSLDSEITPKPVRISAFVGESSIVGEVAKQYLSSTEIENYTVTQLRDNEDEVQADLISGKADFGFVIPVNGLNRVGGTQETVTYYPGKFTERNMTAESVLNKFLTELTVRESVALVIPEQSFKQISGKTELITTQSIVQVGTLVAGNSVEFGHFSALQYYAVAYLIMFLLYGGMAASISLSEERESGTLHRLYAMPVSINTILFGKLVGVTLFALIQSIVIVGFTKVIYGVDWGTNYGGIALICMLVSFATVSFAVLLTSFIRSRRALESIYSLLITSMTFLSGGMIADLGQTVHQIGKFTINHWANEALRQLMAGDSLRGAWQEIVILSIITVVFVAISAIRFKKAVAL